MINRLIYTTFIYITLIFMAGCGGSSGGPGEATAPPTDYLPDLTDVYPYIPATPYAGVLKTCATAELETGSCLLSKLPLIGQEHSSPTTANIMDRVLVSHDWMGANFEAMLDLLNPDIKILLKGVTAIVIDDDILPAYYSGITGVIYIDPEYLWLTQSQLADIPVTSDFRSDYGADLQFVELWRYIKNNNYAFWDFYVYYTRTKDMLIYPLAGTLYHELAHANDFIPPALLPNLDPNQTLLNAIDNHYTGGQMISQSLFATNKLKSDSLKEIAAVKYDGVSATTEQNSFTPEYIGSIFEPDGAIDLYSYSTIFEDTAMLFEELMMKKNYDIDRDVAFSVKPSDMSNCDEYIVKWGVRNRIADPQVSTRANYIASQLLPGTDFSLLFYNQTSSESLYLDLAWCRNYVLNNIRSKPSQQIEIPLERFLRDQHRPL